MWAYTDDEIDYLSNVRPASARTAVSATGRNPAAMLLRRARMGAAPLKLPARWLKAWLRKQADRFELNRLDDRSLADLGINRGDFPAILAGTYTRGGESASRNPTTPA